jgi:preprotein translocase subunit SecF
MIPIKKWNIIGQRRTTLLIALVLFLVSVSIMSIRTMTKGSPFNLGVDFTGGVVINVDFITEEPPTVGMIRDVLATHNQERAIIQQDKLNPQHFMIRMKEITNEEQDVIIDQLEESIGQINDDSKQIDFIGPTIGSELRRNAFLTIGLALLLILLYVAIRFRFKDGVAAIIALTHDIAISLGIMSLLWIQFNTASIAALLSITAYSLQDSIVILDRVRENLKYYRDKMTFAEIANMSITTTWIRSFNTSVTTLIGVLVLAVFMGSALRDFSSILLVGLIAGTYSSLYIVVPLLVGWQKGDDDKELRPVYLEALQSDSYDTIKTRKVSQATTKVSHTSHTDSTSSTSKKPSKSKGKNKRRR